MFILGVTDINDHHCLLSFAEVYYFVDKLVMVEPKFN